MIRKKHAFVKLESNDRWLWEFVILPVLDETDYIIRTIADATPEYESVYDLTVKLVKDSDLLITNISNFNANNSYELGLAHAWGKPTIIFSEKIENVPPNFARMPLISTNFAEISGSESSDKLKKVLFTKIRAIEKEKGLIDKTTKRFSLSGKLVSIHFDSKPIDPVVSFRHVSELLKCFEEILGHRDFKLVEIHNNSLNSIIELSLSDIATLIEKIIFFIPEWRKKNAEIMRINAQTRKIEVETANIESATNKNEAETLINLLKSHRELGYKRITFGNKLIIDYTDDEEIIIHDYEAIVDHNHLNEESASKGSITNR